MSYTPYTWQSGETITAEKLNNIEAGISTIIPSGDISTGPLQNGDTLIFQTPDNKIRKMKYVEAKVELSYISEDSVPTLPEDSPDLIGTPENISNLYKLLDLEAFTVFKEVRIILENHYIGAIGLCTLSGVSQTEEGYQFTHSSGDGYIAGEIFPNLNKGFLYGNLFGVQNYIECKGFIPVEE